LLARDQFHRGTRPRWFLCGCGVAWLLFFPNAPYICTDIVHLKFWFHGRFWIELCLILLFAFTGLILGFLSLHLMQSIVTTAFGTLAGWAFAACMIGLSSLGVYLGRFLRFNSWDVILRPAKIYRGLDAWIDGAMVNLHSLAFLALFAAFLFVAHLMLHALTGLSLRPEHPRPAEAAAP
jgi:uncharacterized membrane protein